MKDINEQISILFLLELTSYAKKGHPLPSQFGLSPQNIKDLSTMNMFEIHELAKSPFFEITINRGHLNQIIQKILDKRSKDEIINLAMQRGATRRIMKKYCSMSFKEFNGKRALLGMDNRRSRPADLKLEDYENLAILHNEFGQHSPINTRFDHLRTLVYLAERSNIELNRIYEYFYRENEFSYVSTGS